MAAPMKIKFLQIITIFILVHSSIAINDNLACEETHLDYSILELKEGTSNIASISSNKQLGVYCYRGVPSSYFKILKRVVLKIKRDDDSILKIYKALTAKMVIEKYENDTASWSSWWKKIPGLRVLASPFTHDVVVLDAFRKSYVAILSSGSPYKLEVYATAMDPMYLTMVLVGIVLFFAASKLCRNVVFYYGTGISIGVFASILILLFIINRFIPKKSFALMLCLYLGGISTFCSIPMYIYYHGFSWVIENYLIYLIAYIALAAVLSFVFLYWRGPIENERTLTLLMWSIQMISLILVYNGIQVREVGIAAIVVIVVTYNLPCGMKGWIKFNWPMYFRDEIPRLLTQEEYYKQGREETRKALKELQEYCQSPECDTWRTVSRLDSPSRFAKFVSGGLHLTQDELDAYDSDSLNGEITRDLELDSQDEIDFTLSTT